MRASNRHGKVRLLATLMVSLLLGGMMGLPVVAQQPGADASAQALARAQSLLRQLAQQKAQLEADLAAARAETAKLKKEGSSTKAALEETTGELELARRESAGVKANLSGTEKRLERVTGQLRDVVAKYKEKVAVLRQTEAEREELRASLDATARQLEDAEKKNLALYDINKEILAEFAKEGPWDGLLRKEPLTGLKRVEVENIVQDIEYRMDDHLRETNREPFGAASEQ